MKLEQSQVYEFMRLAQQATPDKPCIPDAQTRELRIRLIREELNELVVALVASDIVETADAITDLLVVVIGCAVACGIDIAPCWDEINRSNMTKFIDGHRREDGKWIKGPSYSQANLQPIIKSQLS